MACGVRYAVRQWKLFSSLIAGFSSARNVLQFSAAFPDQRLAAFRAGRKQWMFSYWPAHPKTKIRAHRLTKSTGSSTMAK